MEIFLEILFVDKIFVSVVCNILILLYLVWDQFLWIYLLLYWRTGVDDSTVSNNFVYCYYSYIRRSNYYTRYEKDS